MHRKILALALILLVPVAFSLACGNKSGSSSAYNSSASVVLTGHIMNAVQTAQGNSCHDGMSAKAGMPSGCVKAGANVVFFNDADQKIYVIYLKEQSPLQTKMTNYVQKKVEIVGVVHQDNTAPAVEIQSIKEVSAKGKS